VPRGGLVTGCLFLLNEVLVAPSGEVARVWTVRRNIRSRGCPAFEEAAEAAIGKWEYEPYTVGGRAVPFCIAVSTNINVQAK
jgi:outer membrane biosynthesis protein TonB